MNPIQPSLVGRPTFPPQRDLVDWENEGTVVALGVDLENYDGEIYLKPKHVIQIAQTIGMVPKTELELKDKIIDQLKNKITELENATGEELINGKLDDIIGYVSGIALQCSCPSIVAEGEEEELTFEIAEESPQSEDLFSGESLLAPKSDRKKSLILGADL